MKISKETINKVLAEQSEKLIQREINKWLPSFREEIAKAVHDVAYDFDLKKMVKKEIGRRMREEGVLNLLSGKDWRRMNELLGRAIFRGLKK